MPKRKKLPVLENNLQETHLVQKSSPMFSLWQSDMTLSEFKILDTYLSRIDSHNPEQRCVTFEKGKLEELLGVSRVRTEELSRRINGLGRFVPVVNEENKIVKIAIFEKAVCERDEETGLWKITLECTPSAMKYIFCMEEFGYLQYKLRSIINLQSRYSYILFLYLEKNRFRKSWEVSLNELKEILNCYENQTYKEYKRFNDLVLKKCHKELTEKTDIKFSYEPIRKGRKVTGIKFILETLADVEPLQLENQITFNTTPALDEDEALKKYGSERISFIAEACNYEFSAEEMRVLLDIIVQLHPDSQDQIARYNYLMRKYNELKLWASREKISNRFSYLKKLLENDLKKQAVCS